MRVLLLLLVTTSILVGCSGSENTSQPLPPTMSAIPPVTHTPTVKQEYPTTTTSPSKTVAVPTVTDPLASPTDFHKGVNILIYGNDSSFQVKAQRELDRYVGLGINSVSLVTPFWIDSCTANGVHTYEATLTDENIALFAAEAHKRGFTVTLRLLLHEETLTAGNCWRGTLRPANRSAWFASYRSLLVRYAAVAEKSGVEIFSLGSELNCLTGIGGDSIIDCIDGVDDRPYWRESIIPGVRSVYNGKLIYSTNHDSPQDIGFWDLIDYVGVDAFYRLDVPQQASTEQILTAWNYAVEKLQSAAEKYGKPVIITELGTTSEVGSFRKPWVWHHGSGPSMEAQARYYAASCQAVAQTVRGIYYWQTSLNPPVNPSGDTGFDPIGKLAEEEIKTCYTVTIP